MKWGILLNMGEVVSVGGYEEAHGE